MILKLVNRGGAPPHADHHVDDQEAAGAAASYTSDSAGRDDENQEMIIKEEVTEDDDDDSDQVLTLAPHFSEHRSNNLPTPFPSTPSPSFQGKRNKSKEVKDIHNPPYLLTKRSRKPSTKFTLALSDYSGKFVRPCKREKATFNGSNGPAQVKTQTVIRAEEVQLSLGSEFPSFVKLLVRSHVSSCFWMGLPNPFSKLHLPKEDGSFILEDESGEQSEIKYIADKAGLSAGWRKFAVGHKLLEGDVLIFQLVEPTKFKVYIIRANDLTEVDGALSLLNLDVPAKEVEADKEKRTPTPLKIKKRKRPNSFPLTMVQKKNKSTGLARSARQLPRLMEQSGNDSEVGSEVLEGSKVSGPTVSFKDVNNFEDFHIVVNGLCIDSELPDLIRMKYYELCCSKSAFLHSRFLPGLYSKLIAGIIGETVNIADAIKSCKITTSRDEFAIWDKSLRSFELLGMKVGFLRNRLSSLRSLALESGDTPDVKRYIEAKSGKTNTEDEIRNLEAKLVELKEASEKFNADIEMLRSKAERYEFEFQEEVDAPW